MFLQVLSTEDRTLTQTDLERDVASGDRKRDVESDDLSNGV